MLAKNCIQAFMEGLFYKYGKFIARHPLPFIIVPIFITAAFSIGMIRFEYNTDIEYLYTPTNGPAKNERTIIQNSFPQNDNSLFLASRITSLNGFAQVVIVSKDGGNVFTSNHFQQIFTLDTAIKNISITVSGSQLIYSDLCSKWNVTCSENLILSILGSSSNADTMEVGFPIHSTSYVLVEQLGGVQVDSNGNLTSVKAVMLSYYVRYNDVTDKSNSDLWFAKLKDYLLQYQSTTIDVYFQTSLSLEEELSQATTDIIPLFSVTYTILFTFSVLTCLMLDWVRSKPWVAMGGEVAAALAIMTSLGMLSAASVPFTSTVASMPFLILGIGIDDMFVILASWRHTSYTETTTERMGLTYKTAAISITVTSITDALAFGIGSITTFRAVTFFCAYTGVAVLFSYIYAITILAACLAYSGMRESSNRHVATCMKIVPKSKAEGRSGAYKLFCTGGGINTNSENETETDKTVKDPQDKSGDDLYDDKEEKYSLPLLTEFLGEKFAPFIMATPSKIVVFIIYLVYIGFSIWGCLSLKEGLQLKNLAPDNSYLVNFYDNYDNYFLSNYGPRVMIVFIEPIDYSSSSVRTAVFQQLDTFRSNSVYYTSSDLTESWLTAFISFLTATSQNPADMTSFISILRTQFLTTSPYDQFSVDIDFNSDFTQITSSRFILQSVGVTSTLDESKLMTQSRDVAAQSSFKITVYHPAFIFYDQYTVILSNTLQNLGIAIGCILFVSLLLLPSIIAVFWVTLSVVSICAGVIGFMVFWNVNLDSISMINIIMCIGFSVDFSAHISYHFTISKKATGNERAIEAIAHLGTPVVQGAISTILGVLILAFSDSYIFRTFFKIIFLVMLFGFCHAMFILPVLLSVIGPATKYPCKSKVDNEEKSKSDKEVPSNPNGDVVAHT